MSKVDLMERSYMEEYEFIIEKDRAEGKDQNTLAMNELKKAKYFFEYLRKNENMWTD